MVPPSVDVRPWKPRTLLHEQWPANYEAVYAWRKRQIEKLSNDAELLKSAKAYYSFHSADFIMHWMDTYNPRKQIKWMPFVFFAKQSEYINFLDELRREQENGLVEKCRDAGATWLSCAYSVHSWLFIPDDAIGWGSRKEQLVDKIGDTDSIFEKMRTLINRLPDIFKPHGWSPKSHATYMKIINPENASTITGESGDNIGRGGRKSMYFKDESAHYERPEKIEAALGDNTNVQIDISSVNGLGNVFHRRRENGIEWERNKEIPAGNVRVFIIDWRDHPEKTQEWYDTRKAKAEREGMQHVFAQEVDRNYSAAIVNTIIPYEYIVAAVDAHLKIGKPEDWKSEKWIGALDVADEGVDRNAGVKRQGLILRYAEEWGERDPGSTARRMVGLCREHKKILVNYDNIGIGSAVKSEYNRLVDEKIIDVKTIQFVGWNAGGSVQDPWNRVIPDDIDSAYNRDFFHNIKSQAWWSLRTRFYKVYQFIKHNIKYPIDELISLDSEMPLLQRLMKELAQPTRTMSVSTLKMLVEKKPEGTKSPNLGDAVVMCYFPILDEFATAIFGQSGT